MIEIIGIYFFCKQIGRAARARGRTAMGYQLAVVGFWFLGEIVGAFIGVTIAIVNGNGIQAAYIIALGGGIAGAILPFIILKNSKPPRSRVSPAQNHDLPAGPPVDAQAPK